MGWCAIDFCNKVWELVKPYIPTEKKKEIARALIAEFENYDMDDMCGDSEVEKVADIRWDDE